MHRFAPTMLAAAVSAMVAGCSAPEADAPVTSIWNTLDGTAPLVIAHRGASGERPEHTIAAYMLAIEQGADVIEPDLVVTADGVLVARHDAYLSTTTNVDAHPEFADRRRELFGMSDWWVQDFTLEELRTLRAIQPQEGRSRSHDGVFMVPTFEEILDLVEEQEAACGCTIAIEPEVKHPAEFTEMGLDPLPLLLTALRDRDLDRADAAVVVQSFDATFLQRMDAQSDVRLAMLYAGPDDPEGNAGGLPMEAIALFADAVGPYKGLLFNADGASSGYVEAAHALGLAVHTWTVRDDREPVIGVSVEEEIRALYALGVDGVFTDFP
ncbi:glycerophosphodiester phosphodiesterase family protein, partial [Hyphobacterium vulgare]